MAHAGPVRLSHDLRIHTSHSRHNSRYNYVVGKNRVQLVGINLSSNSLRHDAWSLHLLSSVRSPIAPVSTRCNNLLCRCVMIPAGGTEVPLLKSTAVFFTRSLGALRGGPLFPFIPAVGVLAFAAWGIGPLVRLARVICFNRTDNSWKKSSSRYIMTQYIQPLLLWSGAILLCRALDPVVLSSQVSQAVKQRFLNFIRSLSTVLAFSYCLSSLIQQAQTFFRDTHEASDTKNMGFDFAGKAVYSAVWVAAVSLFMELLGFSTQKWVTAGGLGTVLLTLAGREIFTNFLSSVMIHATRPFVVNEWIQTKIEGYEVSGTVEHVGWWSPTIIRGDDREAVHIPNHKFTVNVVRNLSQKTHWRIKSYITISHLDVNKINNIVADMRKVLAKNPQVEQQKLHRRVFLENIDPENQALMIMVSCFVKTSHFEEHLCVKEAILLDLLRVVSHHGARLATPIRTVQKIYSTADMENVPFSDSIYSRSKGTTNRPYLLVEPSYKVNGTSSRARQSEDNKEAQAEAPSVDNSKAGSASSLDSKTDDLVAATSMSDSDVSAKNSEDFLPEPETQDSANGAGKETTLVDSKDTSPPEETLKLPLTGSQAKQNGGERPPSSTPAFEENIVLGVALDGSKRTLPIEDDVAPSTHALGENIVLGVALDGSKRTLPIEEDTPPEPKELAAQNSGTSFPDSAP